MQTSIDLQEPFNYSVVILLCFISLSIIATIFLFYSYRKQSKLKEKVKEIPEKNKKNIPVIKGKYIDQLDSIEYKYSKNLINVRQAYQQISESIRMFVFEITDITTQNYTLEEIKKINIPELYDLIEEYYEPEFASKSENDFIESINKARRVIKRWS